MIPARICCLTVIALCGIGLTAPPAHAAAVDIVGQSQEEVQDDGKQAMSKKERRRARRAEKRRAKAGEPAALTPEQQAAAYTGFFAEDEAAARSSRERLALAATLVARSDEADLQPIRDHMLDRAYELAAEHDRKREGLELMLAAHRGLYSETDDLIADPELAAERQELLVELLRKVRGEDQLPLLGELQHLLASRAAAALTAEKYVAAGASYEELAAILVRSGDRAAAAEFKHLAELVEAAADEAAEIAELRPAVATDRDAALRVGRYDFARGADDQALVGLAHAGEAGKPLLLATDALGSKGEQLETLELVAAALAVEDQVAVRRQLLRRGMVFRRQVLKWKDQALVLRAKALTEGWAGELAALGPDPLRPLEIDDLPSEAQLVGLGWKPAFDHESLPGREPDNKFVSVTLSDEGTIVLRMISNQSHSLSGLGALALNKACLVRFRVLGAKGGGRFFISVRGGDKRDLYRLHTKGTSQLESDRGGAMPLAADDGWNDLILRFDGRAVQAELNGEAFEPGVLEGPVSRCDLWAKTREGEALTVEIASILVRN